MVRERPAKMKKIGNATARQLALSKRRRGTLRKAEELSALGDAEDNLIIFSSIGKLFEYSSSSRKTGKEHIQGMNMEELNRVEKILETGLSHVLDNKEKRIMEQLSTLRKKADELIETNIQLKKKMALLLSEQKHSTAFGQSNHSSVAEEGSVNVVPVTTPFEATSSDTSLKLGLPFSN